MHWQHGVYAAGATSRSHGSTIAEKVRDTSNSFEKMANVYRGAAEACGMPVLPIEQLYTQVRDELGMEKYLSYQALHTEGAVPHAEIISRHQAKQAAKRGDQGDISGTSKYQVRYIECEQKVTKWGTLSWANSPARNGSRYSALPVLSIPEHTCSSPSCQLRSFKGKMQRTCKADLLSLLESARDGGQAVWVGDAKYKTLICPITPL